MRSALSGSCLLAETDNEGTKRAHDQRERYEPIRVSEPGWIEWLHDYFLLLSGHQCLIFLACLNRISLSDYAKLVCVFP